MTLQLHVSWGHGKSALPTSTPVMLVAQPWAAEGSHSTLPCSKRKEPSSAVPKTTEELEVEKVIGLPAHSMHCFCIQLQPISVDLVQQLRAADTCLRGPMTAFDHHPAAAAGRASQALPIPSAPCS